MKTILLVEDNKDERLLIQRLLKKNKVKAEILIAIDGQEAIEMLDHIRTENLPHFVLLDIKMPRMDGHQVLTWIRHNLKTQWLPVIIFSTSDAPQDIRKSYELGANAYVQKKVDNTHDLKWLSV